ncbi:hypothetical protein BT67DRAFT_262916 [Trichocladium antarcticum]|uniref:Uncharacterized protein n=1 Tax=Trichocladium antarcticum TaxID=1450529 RepID=A0AAN6ZFK3_9PEZI|nr:hypothetical protein BT67DRAFT_262916 [Trichocladium antarcticum]
MLRRRPQPVFWPRVVNPPSPLPRCRTHHAVADALYSLCFCFPTFGYGSHGWKLELLQQGEGRFRDLILFGLKVTCNTKHALPSPQSRTSM